ncbi:MAG: nucleoside hydrolase [Opitutaceae bacterium]|nr:nucleoside hydrolase [Opitutaceae bacterium]
MAGRRKLLIDQDTLGPASTNLQSVALLLNAPDTEVLGIGVVTGDHWRDQQVRHALRLLEIMGRTGVPVFPGAEQPLLRTPATTAAWEQRHGKLIYNGAWDLARPGKWAHPRETRDLPEGNPTTAPSAEVAASAYVRLARAHPGEISLWCAGPLTNVALACRLDPEFPTLVRELHFMGGSFRPGTQAREFRHTPRREFNVRFDPEAARIVFRAPWPSVTCSPIDVSNATHSTPGLFAAVARAGTPLAHYLDQFGPRGRPMWDEIAAATWLDASLVTHHDDRFIDVNLDRGAGHGDMLSWVPGTEPGLGEVRARVQQRIDPARFFAAFTALCSR